MKSIDYKIIAANTIYGGSGNDFIVGKNEIDRLYGDAGDDRIRAGGGDDLVYGGDDSDRIFGDTGNDMALQPDGKIVVVGSAGGDVVLIRYNSDGSLDTSFGYLGITTTDINGFSDKAEGVALQQDGRIVVVGRERDLGNDPPYSITENILVARYISNGQLDANFGNGGSVLTDVSNHDLGYAVVLQSDGKIVVAGEAYNQFLVARYLGA